MKYSQMIKKKLFLVILSGIVLFNFLTIIVIFQYHHKIYLYANKIYSDYKIKYTQSIYLDKIFEESYLLNNKNIKLTKYHHSLFSKMAVRNYVQIHEGRIFIINGNGNIYFSTIEDFDKKKILNKIDSNFNLLVTKKFYSEYPNNIQHFLIQNDKIYISYTKKESNECYYNAIAVADINFKNLNFKEFFLINECNYVPTISGGRLSAFNNDEILYSIGDSGAYEGMKNKNTQNMNSFYGKIIKINKINKNYTILSLGLRNPEGLFYDDKDNIIYSTDHGPTGGDEVNIQILDKEKINNYGWAVSSYGTHSSQNKQIELSKYRFAPLYKSHKKYGFKEPLYYFEKSTPPTQILRVVNFENNEKIKILYFGTLGFDVQKGQKSIHQLILNEDLSIKEHNVIPINERIRDLVYDINNNRIFLYVENSASLAILELMN
jgi:hypothetical protein